MGTAPTNYSSHITELNDLSHGIKIRTSLFRFVTNYTFDRQTKLSEDRQLELA